MADAAPVVNQKGRAESLSHAAECLARAAAKLSEAARAMSLVAGALSQGKQTNISGINAATGKSTKSDPTDLTSSTDVATNEDEGVGLPQPYSLLLDDEADVLLVLCSLIYDLPKVVCYFTCGPQSLKFYKTLIDGVTAANVLLADPSSKSSFDRCYATFLKAPRSILLLPETDVPSTPAKEVSEYTVIHVGWPVSQRQYVAQRRAHYASTSLLLAYSGDKDLYSSGPSIVSQAVTWPGDTGGFRASVDIFRPLFEEGLSEISFELKEEAYIDWIHLHSRQGPRSVSSWTPSALVKAANRFVLGPLAYRSPRSLVQGSTLQTTSINLLPEVPAEFVTQHGLQSAVDEGLLRVESDVEVDNAYEPGVGASSADRMSAEGTGPDNRSETLFNHLVQNQNPTDERNDEVQTQVIPQSPGPSASPKTPSDRLQFEPPTGQTYFAIDEEFDAIPLICLLSSKFEKTVLFLEGIMIKRYGQLFGCITSHKIISIKPQESQEQAAKKALEFATCPSPTLLLISHTLGKLPIGLKQHPVGCCVYWTLELQIQQAKKHQSQITCPTTNFIISNSHGDKQKVGLSGFKEHPQASILVDRGNDSLLGPMRTALQSALMSNEQMVQGLYTRYIISLRGEKKRKRSAEDSVRIANHYAAKVLLHGNREDGSKIYPPVGGRPSVKQRTVSVFQLQPAVKAGLLSVK